MRFLESLQLAYILPKQFSKVEIRCTGSVNMEPLADIVEVCDEIGIKDKRLVVPSTPLLSTLRASILRLPFIVELVHIFTIFSFLHDVLPQCVFFVCFHFIIFFIVKLKLAILTNRK